MFYHACYDSVKTRDVLLQVGYQTYGNIIIYTDYLYSLDLNQVITKLEQTLIIAHFEALLKLLIIIIRQDIKNTASI